MSRIRLSGRLKAFFPDDPDMRFFAVHACFSCFGCAKSQDREQLTFYSNCMKTEKGKRQLRGHKLRIEFFLISFLKSMRAEKYLTKAGCKGCSIQYPEDLQGYVNQGGLRY